ncbi:MAG: IS630 family transposase [bacterium]
MKDSGIEVWAEDEVHFQRTSTLIRAWALKGKQPHILSASTKEKIGFFGAVSLKSGQFVTQTAPTFNSKAFNNFLCHLLGYIHKPTLLILDRASYHRAKSLKPFLAEHQDYLKIVFLPPYSPELNPIERVWKITRRRVIHNRYFPTLKELEETLTAQFAQ